MGQQNNSGRNASLDQHKRRAAGRQNTNSPESRQMRGDDRVRWDKGKTAGASGRRGVANPRGGAGLRAGAKRHD